eukprot:7198749-Prymnesium_polylepis.1
MAPGRWWTGAAAWVGPSPQDRVRSHSCGATHAVVRPVTKWSWGGCSGVVMKESLSMCLYGWWVE